MNEVWKYPRIFALALAASLGGSACGGKGTVETVTIARTVTEPLPTQPAVTTTSQDSRPTVEFDHLGARDPTIFVYPCADKTKACKTPNGEYLDGYTMLADCKTEGRTVTSVEPEPFRRSNDWIRLITATGETQLATAVYTKNPEELLKKLKNC